jgi:hypothetical protein
MFTAEDWKFKKGSMEEEPPLLQAYLEIRKLI